MKVVILAGGLGLRLVEETKTRPKPMVEIGNKPILWHIMQYFSQYDFRDFIVALGYMGDVIKKYFHDLHLIDSNLKVRTYSGEVTVENSKRPDWTIELIETGLETKTGGRIKRLKPYLQDQTFILVNGDGISNVDIHELLQFHRSHGKLATLTAVRSPSRFGHLEFEGDEVVAFSEKPESSETWINAAIFVLESGIFDYIEGDHTKWEVEPLEQLTRAGQLMVYKHSGFWQCMDTIHEKRILDELWRQGNPPWKIW